MVLREVHIHYVVNRKHLCGYVDGIFIFVHPAAKHYCVSREDVTVRLPRVAAFCWPYFFSNFFEIILWNDSSSLNWFLHGATYETSASSYCMYVKSILSGLHAPDMHVNRIKPYEKRVNPFELGKIFRRPLHPNGRAVGCLKCRYISNKSTFRFPSYAQIL